MKATPDLWHKYTADYELVTVKDKKGRERKEARYTGPWFCLMGSSGAVRTKLILSAVCGVILAGLLVWSQIFNHSSAWAVYVAVPQAVALFPLLYLLMGLMSLPYDLKPMERPGYMHGIIRVCRSLVAVMVLCGISLIGDFIYRVVAKDWLYLQEDIWYLVILAGILVLGGVILYLLYSIEIAERANHAVHKE